MRLPFDVSKTVRPLMCEAVVTPAALFFFAAATTAPPISLKASARPITSMIDFLLTAYDCINGVLYPAVVTRWWKWDGDSTLSAWCAPSVQRHMRAFARGPWSRSSVPHRPSTRSQRTEKKRVHLRGAPALPRGRRRVRLPRPDGFLVPSGQA